MPAYLESTNPGNDHRYERAGFRRIGVHERLGRDATGRWRDVVLLERRSASVGDSAAAPDGS